MTFARPELLTCLPVVVALVAVGIVWQWRRSVRLVRAYGGREAARRLTGRTLDRFPAVRLVCVLLGTTALVLAAAGMRPDDGEPPPPPTPVDLIVALDVSHSMTATDVAPSRTARAREAVARVLEAGVADRVALTLFAGWPYGLVPVTDDAEVVEYFIASVTPEVVEERHQGTSLAAVVGHAAAGWRARFRTDAIPVLLIVADGDAHGAGRQEALDSVAAVTGEGLRVWTAGVGTPDGAPLLGGPSSAAPLLDGSGQPVIAGYDADLMREMARVGGGGFHDVGEEMGVDALIGDLRTLSGGADSPAERPLDPTALLLLVGLALLAADAVLDSGASRAREPGTVFGRAST